MRIDLYDEDGGLDRLCKDIDERPGRFGFHLPNYEGDGDAPACIAISRGVNLAYVYTVGVMDTPNKDVTEAQRVAVEMLRTLLTDPNHILEIAKHRKKRAESALDRARTDINDYLKDRKDVDIDLRHWLSLSSNLAIAISNYTEANNSYLLASNLKRQVDLKAELAEPEPTPLQRYRAQTD